MKVRCNKAGPMNRNHCSLHNCDCFHAGIHEFLEHCKSDRCGCVWAECTHVEEKLDEEIHEMVMHVTVAVKIRHNGDDSDQNRHDIMNAIQENMDYNFSYEDERSRIVGTEIIDTELLP